MLNATPGQSTFCKAALPQEHSSQTLGGSPALWPQLNPSELLPSVHKDTLATLLRNATGGIHILLSPHPLESYISQGSSRGIRHSSSYFWLLIFSLKSIISTFFFLSRNDSSKSLCKNQVCPANIYKGVRDISPPQSRWHCCEARIRGSLAVLLPTAAATGAMACQGIAEPAVGVDEGWFAARHAAEARQPSALFSRARDGFLFNLCENWIYGIGVRAIWTWPIKLEESYFSLQQATFNSSAGCLFAVTRQKFCLCCLWPFYSFLWQGVVVWSTVPVML